MDKRALYINQPGGLGDILFLQGLVGMIWKDLTTPPLYEKFDCIIWGIAEQYYDIVTNYWSERRMKLPVSFHIVPDAYLSSRRNLPQKPAEVINQSNAINGIALNFICADRFFPSANVMESKVMLVESLGLEVPNSWDWRDGWFLPMTPFDHFRVDNLLSIIEQDQQVSVEDIKSGKIILANGYFGTPPDQKKANRVIPEESIFPIVEMKLYEGTNLWDWLPLIQTALEIRTVETSLCYLIDKFSTTDNIFQYEKREDHAPQNYFKYASGVYKNPNWKYEGRDF